MGEVGGGPARNAREEKSGKRGGIAVKSCENTEAVLKVPHS